MLWNFQLSRDISMMESVRNMTGIPTIVNSIIAKPRRRLVRSPIAQVSTRMVTVRTRVVVPGRRFGIGIRLGVVYWTVTWAAFAPSGLFTPDTIEVVTTTGEEQVLMEEPTLGRSRN